MSDGDTRAKTNSILVLVVALEPLAMPVARTELSELRTALDAAAQVVWVVVLQADGSA